VKYHISIPSNHKCGIEKQNIKKDKNLAGEIIKVSTGIKTQFNNLKYYC
jgi:hypothetical protein